MRPAVPGGAWAPAPRAWIMARTLHTSTAVMRSRNPSPRAPPLWKRATEPGLRQFLEERGILSKPEKTIDFISRKATPPTYALRRVRLPNAKAKALALESRALREQAASVAPHDDVSSDALPQEQRPSLPLSASHVGSSDLSEVAAFATAQSYNFDVLLSSGRLPANWMWLEDREVIYVPAWPSRRDADGVGSVFIFRSGCYTTWGLSPEQNAAFYHEVLRNEPVAVEQGRYDVAGDEAMEFVYLSNEETRVVGDLIVVGQPAAQPTRPGRVARPDEWAEDSLSPSRTLQARLAFSQGLAASARLSVQESVLAAYVASVSPIPELLEQNGKVPLPRRELIRKLGSLLRLRQQLNLDRDNFLDDPELYWENSHMEALYRSTLSALDMKPRFDALNAKLNYCEHLLEVLRALLTEESSHRMELIIIYLIAFEVAMALVSHEYVPTPLAVWHWAQAHLS